MISLRGVVPDGVVAVDGVLQCQHVVGVARVDVGAVVAISQPSIRTFNIPLFGHFQWVLSIWQSLLKWFLILRGVSNVLRTLLQRFERFFKVFNSGESSKASQLCIFDVVQRTVSKVLA